MGQAPLACAGHPRPAPSRDSVVRPNIYVDVRNWESYAALCYRRASRTLSRKEAAVNGLWMKGVPAISPREDAVVSV
jgi:hypothetical protein